MKKTTITKPNMKKLLFIAAFLLPLAVQAQDTSQVAVTIDGLIEKYSPTIQEGFEKLYDFTKVKGEQAVEIFYRYLLIQDVFWLCISILFQLGIVLIYFKLTFSRKNYEL